MALQTDPSHIPSWEKWSRRLAHSSTAVVQQLGELRTDLQLLTRHWPGGNVVRQQWIEGSQLVVFANEDVGRQIYFFRKYEQEESAHIRENIRQTDVCFDIGANIGYYTMLFSKATRNGTVHSFEPVPLNYQMLTTNLMLNGVENVVPNAWAVGAARKEVDFVVTRDGAYSSIAETGRKPVLDRVKVWMTTLDEYCLTNRIPQIDILKVDVEGAEEQVIEGASELLRNCPPRLVMLELYEPMLCVLGSGIEPMLERMRGFGYSAHTFVKGKKVAFEKEHYNRFQNVFFSRET